MKLFGVFRETNKSYKMYMMMFCVFTERERQVIQSAVHEGVLFFERDRQFIYEMYMRVFCAFRETNKSYEMYMMVICAFRERQTSHMNCT